MAPRCVIACNRRDMNNAITIRYGIHARYGLALNLAVITFDNVFWHGEKIARLNSRRIDGDHEPEGPAGQQWSPISTPAIAGQKTLHRALPDVSAALPIWTGRHSEMTRLPFEAHDVILPQPEICNQAARP